MKAPYCAVCDVPVEPVEANLHGAPPRTSATATGIPADSRDWYCDVHRPGSEGALRSHAGNSLAARFQRLKDAQRRLPVAPIRTAHLADAWLAVVPALYDALGKPMPDAHRTTQRSWQPMDGVEPPHCPFVDIERWYAGGAVALETERAFWSEGELARAQVTLTVTHRAGATRVAGHVPADGSSDDVHALIVTGEPLPTEVERLILAINADDRAQ